MSERASRDQVFDELIRAEGAALRRLTAVYEANPARREDLFQEIALAVWAALPRFRGEASLRTFVYRIAHNQGLRHASRAVREKNQLLEQALEIADHRSDLQEDVERRQRAEHLRSAIRRLPLVLRQAIVLQLEGLSSQEIAEVLGTSVNGVLIRLSRAKSKLREILREGESS